MKKLFTTILLGLSVILGTYAQNHVTFRDSLTNVTLQFPEGTKITHQNGFHRATAVLEKTDVKIYSMKSDNGKQFTWDQVNNFDSKDAYGKMLRYERTEDKLDGWIRYYTNKTKQGREYVTCVVLVRGHDYAFYLTEAAYKEEFLSIPGILDSADFPKATSKTRTKQFNWFAWIVEAILTFFSVIFFKTTKKMSDTLLWIIGISTVAGATLWGVMVLNMGWSTLFVTIIAAASWGVTSGSESRWDAINVILKNIGD